MALLMTATWWSLCHSIPTQFIQTVFATNSDTILLEVDFTWFLTDANIDTTCNRTHDGSNASRKGTAALT
jgi:hypothetical protein